MFAISPNHNGLDPATTFQLLDSGRCGICHQLVQAGIAECRCNLLFQILRQFVTDGGSGDGANGCYWNGFGRGWLVCTWLSRFGFSSCGVGVFSDGLACAWLSCCGFASYGVGSNGLACAWLSCYGFAASSRRLPP